jgi:hypothetical protein
MPRTWPLNEDSAISCNLLVASLYLNEKAIRFLMSKNPDDYRLLIDSGAFSVSNSGATINLDEYIKMLKALPDTLNARAIQLDVIGNPAQTKVNYHKMLDAGLNPIPVFQRGAPLEDLEHYFKYSDYVMLAGGRTDQGYMKEVAAAATNRKVHWLGCTRLDVLKEFEPWSADSITWGTGGMFGRIMLYDWIKREIVDWYPAKDKEKALEFWEKYGRSNGVLVDEMLNVLRNNRVRIQPMKNTVRPNVHISAMGWQNASYGTHLLHDTRLFLACNSAMVEYLFLCWKTLQARGIVKCKTKSASS